MNRDDDYQAWLNARRSELPSAKLTDRIMFAVHESATAPTTQRSADVSRLTIWRRAVPYLVCSAAALVFVARIYSIVCLFVVPSPITDVALIEPAKENSHEP